MSSMQIVKAETDCGVFEKEGEAWTTSRKVAEYFGKDHKNVLRDIQNLEVPEDFRLLNFEQTFYIKNARKHLFLNG